MVTVKQQNNEFLKDLLRLAVAGDADSYQRFLLEISKVIRALICKKISAAEIEDVVQEILISIHKARHTYDFERPLMPWIMSIASFRVTDHLRKHYSQMRHKTSDIDEFVDVLTDVTNEPSGSELVSEMFLEIDSKHQKILTMMYVEGYSAKEVGSSLGMNESAVKVAAHRAIKKIKQKFLKQ